MMPTLFKTLGPLLNIAHRGASARFPENTLSSFRGALDVKADMIELDVQFSKDRIPVVFHDAKLNAHSDGKGRIKDYTFKELQAFDAGSWFDLAFAGETIPSLEEVLRFAEGKIALNIEIKTEAVSDGVEGGIEQVCLQLVEKYNMKNHVLFSSFDWRAVSHLKQLNPAMSAAILYSRQEANGRSPSQLIHQYEADAFNCSYRQATPNLISELQSRSIPVLVYTVDQPERMERLIAMGASGIFTNHPDILNRTLHKFKAD